MKIFITACLLSLSATALCGTPTVTNLVWTNTTPYGTAYLTFVCAAFGINTSQALTPTGSVLGKPTSGNPVSTPCYWFGRTTYCGAGGWNMRGVGIEATLTAQGTIYFPLSGIITVNYVPRAGEAIQGITANFKMVEGHRIAYTGTVIPPSNVKFSGGMSIGGTVIIDGVSPTISGNSITGVSPLSNIPSFPTDTNYVPYWRVPQVPTTTVAPSTTTHNLDGSYTFTFDTSSNTYFLQSHLYMFSITGANWVGGGTMWSQAAYGLASITNTGANGGTFAIGNPN